jgi:hypothetical protein
MFDVKWTYVNKDGSVDTDITRESSLPLVGDGKVFGRKGFEIKKVYGGADLYSRPDFGLIVAVEH